MDLAHQKELHIINTKSTVAAYKYAYRLLQKYTRAQKSEWWEMKARKLQRSAYRNNMKGLYSGQKKVWGPQTKRPTHLKSPDGGETFSYGKSVKERLNK